MKIRKLISLILTQAVMFSAAGICAVPAGAASASEQSFFAELNYGKYKGLSAVKDAAEKKDYAAAKKELLKYYKERRASGTVLGFDITEADENYGMAVLPMRNILTGPYEFDMWQGEFTVTDSAYRDYTVDVTDRIASELANGAASFMLFAGDKQEYPVYARSKESGSGPRLKVTFDNGSGAKTVEIPASQDTYISSKNTSKTYGGAVSLPVKEDGTGTDPTGSETTRAYITFPLDAAKNSTIISAELIINAAYDESCSTGGKDVLVINVGDTTWSEDSLTWAITRGSIYSYQNADVPKWNASAPNADSEYHNVTARFWFGRPMAYEYMSWLEDPVAYNAAHPYSDTYPGESFGPKLVELMSAFAQQMNYGWPRTLETGERLNRWVDIVDALLATDVFDGREDDFYNIITFMYGDCKYLNGLDIASGKPWWSNWRIVANAGFFKAAEYLPELNMHDTFRAKVEYNVEYTMDLLYNDDMSFSEAGPSYAQWCAELFGDCVRMAEKAGDPMSGDFKAKLKYAALYAAESFFPDGFDTNIGDSNYRDKMPKFKVLAELLNDPVLNAYTAGDADYTENLTSLYPEANSVFMRTGWDPENSTYMSFINNPSDGHYHPDSDQVLMYAYGQPLLVDSGRYSYSDTNDIYDQLRTAAAHNTVEAVGVSMAAHTKSADKMTEWADNGLFTFVSSPQHGYANTVHTRNVLFFKRDGLPSLVTDYITGTKSNTYRQNWHFLPSSNAAADENTITTDFYGKANISVANADSNASATVRDGYFSADYGLVAKSKYASFEKSGTEVKFSTVLMPSRAGERSVIKASDTASGSASSAVSMTSGGSMSFYVKNSDKADGTFADFTTDAKAAFADTKNSLVYGIADGTSLASGGTDYISCGKTIKSVGVICSGGTAEIYGDDLAPDTDKTTAIKLYAPGVSSVTLNGVKTDFTADGDYIYAAAVSQTAKPLVTIAFTNESGTQIAPAVTVDSAKDNYLYTYSNAPETIEFDGTVYTLDKSASELTAVVKNGSASLKAVYKKGETIKIQFRCGGVIDEKTASAASGSVYTFEPESMYRFGDDLYITDMEHSTLSAVAGEGSITVCLTKYAASDNLITNGDFSNGTADWTNAADGGQYTGVLSENAAYIHGGGKAVTNSVYAGGSAASTLRRFIPAEGGKTYYLSFYAYNTGAEISSNAFMSAFVPVKGSSFGSFNGVVFKDYLTCGGQNSWSAETQSEVKRDRADMYYAAGMNHKEYILTLPADADNILISMFAWTDPGRLYFSDFELREITPEPAALIFDGSEASAANVLGDYTIIAAQYDADGTLIDVDIAKNSPVTVDPDTNTAETKAFLWDSANTMEPITGAAVKQPK